MTYENAAALKREIPIGTSNARVNEIKTQIKTLGVINLSSIEEYKSVFERHGELNTQCEDLHKAKQDLQTLIVELTGTMESVFLRQFTLISPARLPSSSAAARRNCASPTQATCLAAISTSSRSRPVKNSSCSRCFPAANAR